MLNEHQIDALQIVLNNPVIMGALDRVFTITLESQSPIVGNEDNKVIGEKYRAYSSSKEIIKKAFTNLETYKKTDNGSKKVSRHI